MTAYELRVHLARYHGFDMRALGYSELLAIHDDEHSVPQDHEHEARTDAV